MTGSETSPWQAWPQFPLHYAPCGGSCLHAHVGPWAAERAGRTASEPGCPFWHIASPPQSRRLPWRLGAGEGGWAVGVSGAGPPSPSPVGACVALGHLSFAGLSAPLSISPSICLPGAGRWVCGLRGWVCPRDAGRWGLSTAPEPKGQPCFPRASQRSRGAQPGGGAPLLLQSLRAWLYGPSLATTSSNLDSMYGHRYEYTVYT